MALAAAALLVGGVGCGPRVQAPVDCEGDAPTRLLDLDDGPDDVSVGAKRVERGWIIGADGWSWAVECDAVPRRVFEGGLIPPLAEGLPWLGARYNPSLTFGAVLYAPLDPWESTTTEELGHSRVLGVLGDAVVLALPGESRDDPDPRLLHVTFEAGRVRESTIVPVTLLQEPIGLGGPFGARSTMDRWVTSYATGVRWDSALAMVEVPDDPAQKAVVEVDFATGRARLVRAGAEAWSAFGEDDRFVLLHVTDPELETRRSFVLDRLTGEELPLGREPGWRVGGGHDRLVTASSEDETHMVVVPELRELWLPGVLTANPEIVADDGTVVLRGAGGWYAVRPGDDVPRLVYPEPDYVHVMGNDLYVADKETPFFSDDPSETFDPESYDFHEPFRLLRIPLDGSTLEPEVVLPVPVYEVVALAGGKWAAFVSLEGTEWGELRGELRIFDPARGSSERVAGDVMLGMEAVNRTPEPTGHPLVLGAPRDELLYVRYGVGDEERAIWRVLP